VDVDAKSLVPKLEECGECQCSGSIATAPSSEKVHRLVCCLHQHCLLHRLYLMSNLTSKSGKAVSRACTPLSVAPQVMQPWNRKSSHAVFRSPPQLASSETFQNKFDSSEVLTRLCLTLNDGSADYSLGSLASQGEQGKLFEGTIREESAFSNEATTA
jgi:hypothetical protein